MKLVIAGGGTGGHLFPGIAVAEALKRERSDADVVFIGTERGIEARAVPAAGFKVEFIQVGALKRVSLAERVKTLVGLPLAVQHCRRLLQEFQADAVLGVGGYASGPALLAARTLGIPTAICEQNSVPGLTNRVLGKLVFVIFGSFESAREFFPTSRYVVVGNPVRGAFVDAVTRDAASFERNNDDTPPTVFMFGGSQGARPLNAAMPGAMAILKTRGLDVRIVHQTGRADAEAVKADYAQRGLSNVHVETFIDDMVSAYRRASVVVCRAGATSCAELTALGVPSILIPFPQAADDHQTKNAMELASHGAAVVLAQSDLTEERLADEISSLLADDSRRRTMSERARELGRINAGRVIARSALAGFRRGDVENGKEATQ